MPEDKSSNVYKRQDEELALTGTKLAACYRRAGDDFLASTLSGMFRHIVTPEDIATHNLILDQVLLMVGDESGRIKFLRTLAHEILLEKKAKISLLKKVAKSIMSVAKG